MLTHSNLLSPSGANKWFNCHGSSLAQLHLPDLYSEPAEQGTGAHMHSEACKLVGLPASSFLGRKFNGFEVTADQVEHIQEYLDLLSSRSARPEHRFIELKMSLPEISKDLFGTLDDGTYAHAERMLYVDDLKYGFDDVSAVDNYQLWIYALMMLNYLQVKFSIVPAKVQMGIFQPRSNSGVKYSSQVVNYHDVLHWGKTKLEPTVKAVENPLAKRSPGAHCKHCKAKINCPEYNEWCKGAIEPPFPLTEESIAEILTVAPTVEKLKNEAIAFGTERIQRGFKIPGCKLVRTNKHRIITDTTATETQLIAAGAPLVEIYAPNKLKSPSQLEKTFKGKKKLLEVVEKYSYKPVGDTKIALLSDSRQAIATTSEVFKND